ncbi:MAG: hypothetical protein ACJAZ1_002076 [Yoonia sp.]|jgi:hypothetical protein
MTHVLTKSETLFVRSERDYAGFDRSAKRSHVATVASWDYDTVEHKYGDEGDPYPFTVKLKNGLVVDVVDGHVT